METNYKPSIIETINLEVDNYIKRNKKVPSRITLSKSEFDEFKHSSNNGVVTAKLKGKEYSIIVGIGY